jgi:hypothetical protein
MDEVVEEADDAMGAMVEVAFPDAAEELPLSTLTYHNSIM